MITALLASILAPGEGADAAHAEDAAHGAGGLPQLDPSSWPGQLFWLAVTFGLLFFLLSRVVLPKIATTIENRRDRIADDLDAAAQNKREADEAVAAYERQLADAKAKAHAIAAKNKAKVDAEIAEESEAAEAEVAARQAAAEARITEMRTEALAHVKDVAAETASVLVETLTGTAPDKKSTTAAVKSVRQG
ncbi:F0F1 ATP synthase subunit B family protein [Hyphobacterium marinum]|uniref:ATP synthase subunit b n=1 Tax=Hyphobacterium marinum TaxID=3116574 RepID=A0ABU7M0Z4_9PROT|nr:F0F1 ATP synthase subunit B' [Hyphobacterium sp. Y6023]MEE2567492.1 F0F1 ATP synthase subunit B' [Hyphobacterium sp. Y6023]